MSPGILVRHFVTLRSLITSLLIGTAVMTVQTGTASAQSGGISRGFPQVRIPGVRELERIPGNVVRGIDRGAVRQAEAFRRALGAVAVATVGATVLARLGTAERAEISKRATRVVRTEPDHEVVETYETDKGRRTVTIKASAAQPKASFADDPALQPEAQAAVAADAKGAKPAKPEAARRDEGVVSFDDVPETTRCRRIETKFAEASTTRTDASPTVTINASVVCELGENEWKPVGKR